MGFAVEDVHKAALDARELAAIQGCKGLQAMAGTLPGMQWQQALQQPPMELHLASCTWQKRTLVLLGLVGKCLPKPPPARKPGGRQPSRLPPSGVELFRQAATSPGCILLSKRLLLASPELKGVLVLRDAAESGAHRGSYLGLLLGHCSAEGGAAAAASSSSSSSCSSKVPVVLLWHQLMALAWHGFPLEPARRCALHLPHACPTQHGLCGCCSHVGWGNRLENSQHRLVTSAARHARFTKVPLSAVNTALQDMSPGQRRTACSSQAKAAELVDYLANELSKLSLQQPRPPPPAAAASSSSSSSSQAQHVASPLQTRHARRARQQQAQSQQQEPAAVRPINSRLQVAVGPDGLQQLQQLAPRNQQREDDASKARRLERAARAAERQQQKVQRWQRDWGGGGQQQQQQQVDQQQQQQPAEPSCSRPQQQQVAPASAPPPPRAAAASPPPSPVPPPD
jgi:hypothetical protein